MTAPSAYEQYSLELLNRFRMDPTGEFARLVTSKTPLTAAQANILNGLTFFGVDVNALEAQLNALTAAAPLAWNNALSVAAETHSQLMINADVQSHQLPGEAGLAARITAAGYANLQSVGENIYAFSQDALHGHAGFLIDWGYDTGEFVNGAPVAGWQTSGDGIQDPPGHRENMMSTAYTEIGIGVIQETNGATQVGEFVTTQNLGNRFNYQAQFVGVVINDADNDMFYDMGEGMGGVSVTVSNGTNTYNTTTWAAGGWQVVAAPGTYTITFSGGGLTGNVVKMATIGTSNVKVDGRAQDAAPANPTNGDDNLTGTAGNDIADLLLGHDTYNGLGGNDTIWGRAGNDALSGGPGNDKIFGGPGWDTLNGGGGIDLILGGSGNDTINGDSGSDTLVGELGADTISGGVGNDIINGGADNDILNGDSGNDQIRGGPGSDTMNGGDNDDFMLGEGGFDFMNGGNGADRMYGGDLNDTMNGESGNDWVSGGTGNDNITGGFDNDWLFGEQGNDTLNGNNGNDLLFGQWGNDTLIGAAGNDTLNGWIGNDTKTGGPGADTFVLANVAGLDTITDYSAAQGDRIDVFAAGTQFSLQAGTGGSFLVYNPTATQIAFLTGVNVSDPVALI